MTPVGDYLKKLLYQYDCLVVPELGAFLTHYRPAFFSEALGEYLPPRKQLAFNEALRLDDGILINYLMLHESVTRDGAMRQIAQFVSGIKQQIRSSGSYTLDGIGLLTTNEEGKFQFTPELRHNFFAESFGLQPIQAQFCQPAEVSLPVAVVPVITQALVQVDATDEEGGKLMPMPVTRRSPWYWAAATLLVGTLGALSYVSVVQPNELLQSSLSPASLLRLPTFIPKPIDTAPAAVPAAGVSKTTTTDLVVKKIAPKPAVASVAPTSPAATARPVAVTPPAHVASPVSIAPAAVRVAVAPVKPTSPVKRTVLPKPVVTPVAVKPFLVVAGSFSSRGNALRLRKQLMNAGFADTYLMMPTRRKELIKVAAYGASNKAEADTVMLKITELTGAPAWLMRTHE